MPKRKPPKLKQMGISGIHAKELDAEVKRLKRDGATEIVVGEDDNEYEHEKGDPRGWHKGPWHTIDYRM